MDKKSTFTIREEKNKRSKLKQKIIKLLNSENFEDFLLGFELAKLNLKEKEFKYILNICSSFKRVDLGDSTISNGPVAYYAKCFKSVPEFFERKYYNNIGNMYLLISGSNIYIDSRIKMISSLKSNDLNEFIDKSLEDIFIKNNPKYEKYFRTTN